MRTEVDMGQAPAGTSVGALIPHLERMGRSLDRLNARAELYIPRSIDFKASGAFPSSGNLLLIPNISGPAAGRMWHVTQLYFCLSAGATGTPAGGEVGYVYVGAQPGQAIAADLSAQYRAHSGQPFPQEATYGDWEVVVRYSEAIYAIVTGGTSTVGYTFGGTVKEVPDQAHASDSYNL